MPRLCELPEELIVVAGPTAAGKTELAVALAEQLGAEIVSADSRQVYRLLDAGTAKPSAELREAVPHHLIDVVDPDEPYDAARWRADALAALADIRACHRRAIVCGGTGLYVRSLTRGLFSGPSADAELRIRLERQEQAAPGSLYRKLRRVDPDAAARIHARDIVRLTRALEVYALTGTPMSILQRRDALDDPPFDVLMLEVRLDRERLARRIGERSRTIVAAGIVEELRALYARGYAKGLKAFDAIGYRQAREVIEGTLPAAALPEAIAQATRAYAKRQLTWLRRQCGTVPVEAGDTATALELASRFCDRLANQEGIR